jgi:hypothetical protein
VNGQCVCSIMASNLDWSLGGTTPIEANGEQNGEANNTEKGDCKSGKKWRPFTWPVPRFDDWAGEILKSKTVGVKRRICSNPEKSGGVCVPPRLRALRVRQRQPARA